MKKIQRAQKKAASGSGKNNNRPHRDKKTTSAKAAFARKTPTRIPVRGDAKTNSKKRPKGDALFSRRGGGVQRRGQDSIAAARGVSAASQQDLAQLRDLALDAMNAALEKKALMPVLIDVSGLASYTDFIGIVSGRSDRQVDAIADSITTLMKSRGRLPLGQEGGGSGRWNLLDFGSIVIHVFYHPIREFYDLESLWIEAPRVKLDIPPEAMLTQPDALYGAL